MSEGTDIKFAEDMAKQAVNAVELIIAGKRLDAFDSGIDEPAAAVAVYLHAVTRGVIDILFSYAEALAPAGAAPAVIESAAEGLKGHIAGRVKLLAAGRACGFEMPVEDQPA